MIAIVIGIKSKGFRCSIQTDASPRIVATKRSGDGAPAGQADAVESNEHEPKTDYPSLIPGGII